MNMSSGQQRLGNLTPNNLLSVDEELDANDLEVSLIMVQQQAKFKTSGRNDIRGTTETMPELLQLEPEVAVLWRL